MCPSAPRQGVSRLRRWRWTAAQYAGDWPSLSLQGLPCSALTDKAQVSASFNQETPVFWSPSPPFPGMGPANQRSKLPYCPCVPGRGFKERLTHLESTPCPGTVFRNSLNWRSLAWWAPGQALGASVPWWVPRYHAESGKPVRWQDPETSHRPYYEMGVLGNKVTFERLCFPFQPVCGLRDQGHCSVWVGKGLLRPLTAALWASCHMEGNGKGL